MKYFLWVRKVIRALLLFRLFALSKKNFFSLTKTFVKSMASLFENFTKVTHMYFKEIINLILRAFDIHLIYTDL